MQAKNYRRLLVTGVLLGFFICAVPVLAQIVPPECLGVADTKSCGIQSLVNVFIRIANFLFGIAGSLAFVFFVYGGFRWITSAGNPEKIKEGRTILVNAVIGLIIIFGSHAGINFIVQAVTKGSQTPIPGVSCKPTSPSADPNIKPRFFKQGEDIACVGSCGDLASLTSLQYACGKPEPGATCVPNLCEGDNNNVCCVKGSGGQACTCTGNVFEPFFATTQPGGKCSDIHCSYSNANGEKVCVCGGAKFSYDPSIGSEETFKIQCQNIKCSVEDIYE